MKVVVTGGAGFIGSALIWKLNNQGITDIIAVDVGEDNRNSKNIANKDISEYIERDKFLELVKTNKLTKDIDIILHMGACADTTETDSAYLLKNNFLYSKELCEWSLKNNTRYLYASSAATYGAGELGYSDRDELTPSLKPLNEYGNSKQMFDLWVLENTLQDKITGFKFFNVYGPNEYHKKDMRSMVNKGYHQIKETGKLRLFKSYKPEYKDGEQERDFIYIKDVLDIIWYFIDAPSKHGIYNIGTGKTHTWNDLANALFKAFNIKSNIEYFDMPDKLKEQYQYFTQADLTKLKAAGCDCEFTDIDDAVKDYVGYLKEDKHL